MLMSRKCHDTCRMVTDSNRDLCDNTQIETKNEFNEALVNL